MTVSQQDNTVSSGAQVALITGGAHRIGAVIARRLHEEGLNLVLHYRHSAEAARALQTVLNTQRPNSVELIQSDLLNVDAVEELIMRAASHWGRLDILVNNASSFYPTTIGSVTPAVWEDLIGTNLRAPFFLAQAAAPFLQKVGGSIVNIVDIHADRPLKNHPVYSIAKAGLVMLTKAMARELGPHVRVNAIAPGAILWPEAGLAEEAKLEIIRRTALKRQGHPQDIANTLVFLVRDADYITGQVITVDGGRSLRS